MTYCTQADLVTRYGATELQQLSDHNNTGSIDATVVAQAIADADAEINGYLQGRYALPLAVVPDALTRYACDLARYRLYDDRATERVVAAYEEAISFLMNVAKGAVSLGVNQGGESAPVSGGPSIASADRVFTAYTLKDFL